VREWGVRKFTCYFSRRERQDAEIAEEGVRFGNHAHNSASLESVGKVFLKTSHGGTGFTEDTEGRIRYCRIKFIRIQQTSFFISLSSLPPCPLCALCLCENLFFMGFSTDSCVSA
jgi:hypothetical protein